MEHNKLTTNALFDVAHTALCSGTLVTARAALDELARRADLTWSLSAPESYPIPPNDYGQLIRDRIELVNAKVENRR